MVTALGTTALPCWSFKVFYLKMQRIEQHHASPVLFFILLYFTLYTLHEKPMQMNLAYKLVLACHISRDLKRGQSERFFITNFHSTFWHNESVTSHQVSASDIA